MMDTAMWQRSSYPRQLPSKKYAPATPPPEEVSKSALVRVPSDTQSTSDSAKWHHSVTEDREDPYSSSSLGNDTTENLHEYDGSSTAVSVSHRSPSPPPAARELQSWSGNRQDSSILLPGNGQNEDKHAVSSWNRSAYPRARTDAYTEQQPLPPASPTVEREAKPVPSPVPSPDQDGVVHRTLRRTPRSRRIESPVPLAEEDASPPTQPTESEEGATAPGAGPWKRKLYPASGAISAPLARPATNISATSSSSGQLKQTAENVSGSTPWDEEKNIQKRLTVETKPEQEAEILTKPPPQQSHKRATRRPAYPLQAMASVTNLQEELTPPPSPKYKCKATKVRPQINTQAALMSKVYPLQSPASIPNFAHLSDPSTELYDSFAPGTDQSRNIDLATKVIRQWKRQVYPLQDRSPGSAPAWQREPEEEAEKVKKPRSIHLPKHMQAVTGADSSEHQGGRTIVMLLDGTGDKFDNDNSNIVHLVSALKKDDPRQVTYYQAGIGTYGAGGLSGGISAAMDMAVGASLGLHVRDAYHFLMHTYKEGDKICIFSFSRGAYTARCLAGMIHKVGLLPPRNIQQISFAYEFYKNDTPEGWKQSHDFKKTFCIDVNVYFLGCFDSVASVGFIPRQLPLSSTPTNKSRYFRHAMALDERRAKFKVCRHQTKTWDDIHKIKSPIAAAAQVAGRELEAFLPNYKDQHDAPPAYSPQRKSHPNLSNEDYDSITRHEAPFSTDVLEVWFAGAHADIGGGAVPNSERHKLAQIPLRWMIRQAFECNTGIIFRTAVLAEHGLDVHTLWPKYQRLSVPTHEPAPSWLERWEGGLPTREIRRGKLIPISKQGKTGEKFYQLAHHTDADWTPEQVEDFFDAVAPLNDQLVQVPNWWILEVIPVEYKVPLRPGEVQLKTGMNLGRYRGVEDMRPNVHWTALHRARLGGYRIGVRTARGVEWNTVV